DPCPWSCGVRSTQPARGLGSPSARRQALDRARRPRYGSFVELGRKTTMGAATLLWGLLCGGCSALVDTEADQCQSTSDCTGRGGEFARSVCSPEKVCVPLL